MVISSSNKPKSNHYRIRSASLPTKSNPILQRLQDHLHTLQRRRSSSPSSAANIAVSLSTLSDLYRCADEALTLPRPHHHSINHHRETLDDLLDASLKHLDAAGVATDAVTRLKEAVVDLKSAIRRRKDEESVEELVSEYSSSRKEMIRIAKSALLGLKKSADSVDEAGLNSSDLNDGVLGVLRGLRCVGVMGVSVHESLLTFLSTSPAYRCRGSRWRVVSRLMGARGEECGVNELGDVDAALHGLVCGCGGEWDSKMGLERYRVLQERIDKLEMGLQGMENGLNCLFRQLIKTRASLLNLLSF